MERDGIRLGAVAGLNTSRLASVAGADILPAIAVAVLWRLYYGFE